jgi:hypothetical protein
MTGNVKIARTVAGDISRLKKVKGRKSFTFLLSTNYMHHEFHKFLREAVGCVLDRQ